MIYMLFLRHKHCLSSYGTFITMANAPVISFSDSSNVVTLLPELLNEQNYRFKGTFCEVTYFTVQKPIRVIVQL